MDNFYHKVHKGLHKVHKELNINILYFVSFVKKLCELCG